MDFPHHVDMKNVVKRWKDFLCYFINLETHRDFIQLRLAQGPQSLSTYHSTSPTVNSGHRLKKYVPVM